MMLWLFRTMRSIRQNVNKLGVLFLLISVIVFGSASFNFFEGEAVGIWEALYWVIVTITTVGYGDVFPKTPGGRVTFVLVALGGMGTIAYVVEQLVAITAKSQLDRLFGLGRVKMKNHTIIVGWNAKTEEAIKELENEDEDFLVVGSGSEMDAEELDALKIPHITGDPTKSDTLNRCNVKDAKTIIIPIENDSDTIMIALAARKLNRDLTIVATCETREHVEMMSEAGIDHIISYAEISGRLLAHAVMEPVVVNFIMDATTSVEGFDLKQIRIESKRILSDVSLEGTDKVIALCKDGKFMINFEDDVTLDDGDHLVLISSTTSKN